MKKTHCKQGHELSPENINSRGRCKKCTAKAQRRRHQANPAKQNASMRAWGKAHPDRVKEYIYKKNRTRRGQFSKIRNKAKQQGREFTLSFDEFQALREQPCHYCGGALPEVGGGIDRIHSDIGYVKGNVRPCCTYCNQAKNSMTEDEFRAWILRIYKYWVES